jgi:hypothetical protein
MILLPVLQIFGKVDAPPGVVDFNAKAGASGIGLILFVSNIIKVMFIIAGLFALFNIIFAGYTYLSSSGDPKSTEKATSSLTYSLLGLAIMVGAFTIISIVSFLLFGDASYILNPVLPTAV